MTFFGQNPNPPPSRQPTSPLSDPSRLSPGPEKNTISTRVLSEEQQKMINGLLEKKVYIISKDQSTRLSPCALDLINKFVMSFMNLYFAQTYADRNEPLFQSPEMMQHRVNTIFPIVTIRGSTTSLVAHQAQPKADLDIVVKFSNTNIVGWDHRFFRDFCKLVGIHAVEMLLTDIPQRNSLFFNRNTRTYGATSQGYNLVDITNGVFKNIFSFGDNTKCFYSFEGLKDVDGASSGVDIDIALQFSADQPAISTPQIDSPISSSTKSSDYEELQTRADSASHRYDSRSFAHDAIEIVLCHKADSIDKTARYYFSGLFGWNIDTVERVIKTQELIVLDPSMHEGYRRIFYEVTRGKLPPKENYGLAVSETAKILQAVHLIRENSPTTIKPGLDTFLKFVAMKSCSKEFAFRFFLNGYICMHILLDTVESADSKEKLKNTIRLFERDFIHQAWQELFPEYVKKVSKQEHSLPTLMHLAEVKNHFSSFSDIRFKESLGSILRLSLSGERSDGFVLSHSRSFDELRLSLFFLNKHLSKDLYTELVQPLLDPLPSTMGQGQEKWLLLYFLRRLEQSQLTLHEVTCMSREFVLFLRLWMENAEAISTLKFDERLLNILKQNPEMLYTKKIDSHILHAGLQLARPYMEESAAFLPTLLLIFHKITEGFPDDASVDESCFSATGEATRLAALFLDIEKSDLLRFDPKKDILKYIALISPHLSSEVLARLSPLLKKSISPLQVGSFTAQDNTAVSILVNKMISCGLEEEVLKIKDTLSLVLDIDIDSIIIVRPDLMKYLDENKIDELFFKFIEERSTQNAEMLFRLFPKRCREIWAGIACKNKGLHKSLIENLEKSTVIKEYLLSDTDWIEWLEGSSQDLAVQYFIKTRTPQMKGQAASFLNALLTKNQDLAILCAISTGTPLQKMLLETKATNWADAFMQQLQVLSEEQKMQLLHTLVTLENETKETASVVCLSLEAACSLTKQEESTNKVLSSVVDHYTLIANKMRSEGNNHVKRIFTPFVKKTAHLLSHGSLSDESRAILVEACCILSIAQINLADYLAWIKKQPRSEATLDTLSKKMQMTDVTVELACELSDVFETNLPLLYQLAVHAEQSNLPFEQLQPLHKKITSLEKNLEKQLQNFYGYVRKNEIPTDFIESLISHLDTQSTMQENERVLFMRCAKALKDKEGSLFKKLIDAANRSEFLGSEKKNYLSIISLIVNNTDILSEPWGLTAIGKNLQLYDQKNPHLTSSLINDPLMPGQSLPLTSHLQRCELISPIIQILSLAISKDSTPTTLSKSKQVFYRLAKDILDKRNPDVSIQEEFDRLHMQFILTYLPKVMEENPEAISSFLLDGSKEHPLVFLDRFSGNSYVVPIKICQDLFQAIADSEAKPQTQQQKTALYRCFYTILTNNLPSEVLLHCAEIYYSVCPKDTNWIEIYRKLFSQAIEQNDHNLLTWLGRHADLGIKPNDNEKKTKTYRDGIGKFANRQDLHKMVSTIEIMELFQRSANLDIKPILLQFITSLLQKKSNGLDLPITIHNMKKILNSSHFQLNQEEIKTVGETIRSFFEPISFDSYIEHLDVLFFMQNSHEVLRTMSKFLLETHAEEFFSYALSCNSEDRIAILSSAYDLLLKFSGSMKLATTLEKLIKGYIENLEVETTVSKETSYNLTILSAMSSLLFVHNQQKEKNKPFCLEMLPYISGDNFHLNTDDLFIKSYASVIIGAESFQHLDALIDNLLPLIMTSDITQEDKERYHKQVFERIIPLYLMMSKQLSVPYVKFVCAAHVLLKDRRLSASDINIFITLFQNFVLGFINDKTPATGAPISAQQSISPVINQMLVFEQYVNSHAVIDCLNILQPHITNSLAISKLSQFAQALTILTSSPSIITPELVKLLPQFMEMSLQAMSKSKELDLSIRQFEDRPVYPEEKTDKDEMLEVYQVMQNFIPIFSSNIAIIKEYNFPGSDPYDNSGLLRHYAGFMKKIDERLISQKPLTSHVLTLFTKLIEPSRFRHLLDFHSGYLDTQMTQTKVDKIISNVRISSGICAAAILYMRKAPREQTNELYPSLVENSNKIFNLLAMGLKHSNGISPLQCKTISILALLNIDLDHDQGFSTFCQCFDTFTKRALLYKQPNMQIIHLMITLMYKIHKDSTLSPEYKLRARDYILGIKSKIKKSLLIETFKDSEAELQSLFFQD